MSLAWFSWGLTRSDWYSYNHRMLRYAALLFLWPVQPARFCIWFEILEVGPPSLRDRWVDIEPDSFFRQDIDVVSPNHRNVRVHRFTEFLNLKRSAFVTSFVQELSVKIEKSIIVGSWFHWSIRKQNHSVANSEQGKRRTIVHCDVKVFWKLFRIDHCGIGTQWCRLDNEETCLQKLCDLNDDPIFTGSAACTG